MSTSSRFRKWIIPGVGALSGAALYYYKFYDVEEQATAQNSTVKWDSNWDRRDPRSLVKPMKTNNETQQNIYNEKLQQHKPTATRHLILIRHGQYNTDGQTDGHRTLTQLGRLQAEATGKRLLELAVPYSLIVKSTMKRAQETSAIIEQSLQNVDVQNDSLLTEGAPIQPDPPIGHWKSEKHFFQDGPRIETAFRKYFHRADPSQKKDSFTVLVCHANVIRYFVCRALQFPAEGWARLNLNHASITWLAIFPSGRVVLYCLGDSGHIQASNVSSK